MNAKFSLRWRALSALALGAMILAAGCNGSKEGTDNNSTSTSTSSGSNEPSNTGAKRPAVTEKGNPFGDKIKVGLVASITGSEAPWGLDAQDGAQMAVDEINAAGGINGKKVELIVGDSASDPEKGKNATLNLMSQGSVVLVGEVASGITIQMAKAAFPKGIPVVAIGATRDDITDEGNNVFRVCYIDSFQGPVMAEFGYNEKGLRKVAVLTDKKLPYSTGLSNTFMAHFKKLGGEIVTEEFYEKGQSDFKAQLTNIKDKNPDGLFLSGYFNEVGPIARQAKDLGLNVVLMGGDGWDSPEIINSGGQGLIGGFFCNHYNGTDTRPEVQQFLSKWRTKHEGKDPGTTMGALGYDATMLALDAIKRAKSQDSAGVIAALDETENLKLVSGDVTLKGRGGNPSKRALVVEVTQAGFVFRKAYEPKDLSQ